MSWSPRIILFHNFLSTEECDYLKALSRPRLQTSTVVDAKTGKGVKSEVRTSSGMFLSSEERKFPIIQAIERRIAVFSQIPAENGELIQVLRYEVSQQYRPHHDYFSDTFNLKRGGQRVATMLMYLNDEVEGGETHFPMAGDGQCSCGGEMVRGICIKPNKGDAVLFWSMGLNGESDHNSLHGGCPVLKGEKWSATKWMRQKATY
ncbi:prolyl 4-hydroxylase [Dendrobium catenatum]|uniref:Prolyl 4-hydroxylase n=2 Tax=Dendrobium catenatum TaxID=906689 RepID=A0A2I0VJD4_9ASPA|nr:prolyl 4-hydroxylase [Dendrobium catenatum]